jgi:PAS domain S-box-containing protein
MGAGMPALKERLRGFSIRAKLLLGYLTAFLVFLVLGAMIAFPVIRRTIETNIESELNNTTQGILNMVRTAADASIKNYLRAVAEKNRDILNEYYHRQQRGELDEAEAKRRASVVLLSQHIGATGYSYCIDSRGIVRVHPSAALIGSDTTTFAFIRRQIKLREGYIEYEWKNPGEPRSKPKALYMTYFAPWDWIISASSYREEFIQLIDIGFFRNSILTTRFGKTGYSYIINSRGDVIVHPVLTGNLYGARDSNGREITKEMCARKNGKIVYTWRNPGENKFRDKLAIFRYIPELDWIVISSSYQEEFYEPLRHLRRVFAVIFSITMLIFFLLTLFYSSYIVNQLNRLIRNFRAGVTGDFRSRMVHASRDEFGKLADCFNGFMEKLDAYRREQARAEDVLRSSEEKYRTLVDNVNVGVVRTGGDPHGRFLQANPATLKIFGFDSYEEMRNTEVAAVYQDAEERERFVAELKRSGSVRNLEIAMRKKDGTPIWVSLSSSVQYDETGGIKWLDSVIEEITERKRLQEQLQHAQKMEAIGTLAGGVAHDFNNLLTAIIGYGDLVKLQAGGNSALTRNVNEILAAAERAAHLTQSLLAFSHRQMITPKLIDLNEIIRRIDRLLIRIIGENIEVRTTPCSQELIIMADGGQIEQVLVNLATNARDAMPDGGLLTIRSEQTEKAEPGQEMKPGVYAVISISDTGHGMDEATRRRIFEPFFTTKGVGKGTGLGLSIVYGIIKQHNGDVCVYSEPGKGTTIRVYFPLVNSKTDETEPPPPTPLVGGTETILVAEDDPAIRRLEKEILEKFGYTVIEAGDGEEAVSRFIENREKIHLLLFDVVMPKKNGRETYEEIRRLNGDIPVIYSSGYTADIIDRRGVLDGKTDFIPKPISPRVLLAKVHEVLARKKSTS